MSRHSEQRILMGNEAIGRGLVEEGCTLAAAYPGTPASEILSAVVAFAKETGVRAPRGVVGQREGRLRDGARQFDGGAALGGGDEAGGAERGGRPLHPRGLPGGQGRLHPDRGRRSRPPQLPDGAGQPPLRPFRQDAGLRPRLAPGGERNGRRGLRPFGEIRDSGHAAADDPRLPRPAERRLPPPAAPGAEGPFRKEPRPVGGDPAVSHRTPPPPEREAGPDRRREPLSVPCFCPAAERGRGPASSPPVWPSPTPRNFSPPWGRQGRSTSSRYASPTRSTNRSSKRSGSATTESSSWRRRTRDRDAAWRRARPWPGIRRRSPAG